MTELDQDETEHDRALVRAERRRSIFRLTLQNPPANVLSLELMNSLAAQLEQADKDAGVRVVVLSAAGKLFSAGHDLKELTAHRADADRGRAFFEQTFALCARLMLAIVNLSKPVIAEVDGIATAAGCQLVASCDLVVASDRSSFGVNGINVGLFCTTPAVALMRVVNRQRAMEMLLTGDMIDAPTAREFGLVNRVVPHASLSASVDQLADRIAAKSPLAVALGKKAVLCQAQMNLETAYEHASRVMVENMLATDAAEGIGAFLERRQPFDR
ncbi:MAG TPA: enoyl-CoA hydratase [Sphingomicrobium sp.]|nr:enoyl-CoA hydratase [Sphingomicrobium sp.]